MGITDFFKSSKLKLSSDDIAEAGACPNCWGKQEWEGKFIAFERDRERRTGLPGCVNMLFID